jgi:glycosyltransferase involved in cell wall biosynthesis
MRVTFISAAQIPSDTANSIQVMKVCQAFSQLGHDVILLVPGIQPKGLQPTDLMMHYGLHTLFNIEWLPTGRRRFFPWKAVQRARRLDTDLLYIWPVQSAVLGLLNRLPVLLEMHDLPSGSFGPLWFRLFLFLHGQKRLLPITNALREALEGKYGRLQNAQTVVSPDGVDLERYASLPGPVMARQNLHLPEALTVLCTGHLYDGRGTSLFMAMASNFPQTSFVWVGGRPAEVEKWKARADERGAANITFTGFVPNESIPLYQSAADVLLMPYEQQVATSSGGNTAMICSPMKMFEYMAAGRAILTSDLPVFREILDESMAIFCPPEVETAWEIALADLLTDEQRRQTLSQHAQARVEKYSWVERSRRSLDGFEIRIH